MNLEEVRRANTLVDQLEYIDRALEGVSPERVDYAMDQNTTYPCPFHVSGAELHAWLAATQANPRGCPGCARREGGSVMCWFRKCDPRHLFNGLMLAERGGANPPVDRVVGVYQCPRCKSITVGPSRDANGTLVNI